MSALVRGPLDGDLLTKRDNVRVFIAPHPLRHERHELTLPAGATVAELVAKAVKATGTPWTADRFTVYLGDGNPVPRDAWPRVRPKPGTTIAMRPVPTEPISALFAAISGAIAGFKAFIAGAGIFGKLLMAGLSFGAKLLMNALFAPKPTPQQAPLVAKPSYSIAGSRNQAALFSPVPVILGRHRVVPAYAALPYTETVGTDQYVRMLFVIGYGPLDISEIKIGETLLSHFADVDYEVKQGFAGDSPTTLYPQQVVEEQLGIELSSADGWHSRTTAENVNEIAIDLVWPRGLIFVTNQGRREDVTSVISWRYRLTGSGDPWTNGPTVTVTATTVDTIRRTSRVSVSAGQYDVEVQKASIDASPASDENIVDSVSWTALRGFRTGEPITFADPVAAISVRIRATSQLNGTIDTLNCMAQSLVTAWDGDSWEANTASRNPADLFRHVLQCAANKRPVADGRIDLESLQEWHSYCATNFWTYDKPTTQAQSIYDTLLEICAAGRAMPIFRDGKWSVVWDEQDSPVVQMFTPRNSWGFEVQHRYQELPHAFRVRFVNQDKSYVEDERIVYDDGYSATNATRFEGIEFPGVTDPGLVWRHGRYYIAQLRLRPATYSLSVDFEGLVLTRGDRVRVAHDVMQVGLGFGRVTAVDASGQTVTVDEVLTLSPADGYMMRFRLADGSFLTRSVVVGSSGELTEIPLDGSGSLPSVGDLFTFGISGSESAVYRVLGIEPRENHVHRLTLVDDAPAIYDADSGEIPEFNSNVTAPLDPFTLPPTDIVITDGAYEADGQFFAYLGVSWKLPRIGRVQVVEVEYRAEADGVWRPAGSLPPQLTATRIDGLQAGLYKVRIRCVFTDGTFSSWNASPVYDANSLLNPPGDVSDFRIATIGALSTLSWSPVHGAGVTYQIRFAPSDVVSPSWNSASPLLPSVSGTSVQVQTMIGTYFIKARLPSGVVSASATAIATGIAAVAGLNVEETLTESPTFPGTRSDLEVVGGELRLLPHNTLDTWESLADIVSLYAGDGGDDSLGFSATGSYSFDGAIDLGVVYTSRITAVIDAYGFDPSDTMASWPRLSDVVALDTTDAFDWSVRLEYRSTQEDPALAEWSVWQQLVVGDVTARALQFRLLLSGRTAANDEAYYSVTTPSVRGLAVRIDMPDELRAGEDLVASVSGTAVTFAPAMRHLDGLGIAAQDMATGDYYQITAKDETGFTIIFRNADGAAVERSFDFVAKGWGRQAA